MGFFAEFRAFITRGNVIDLAVAVVVGTAFGAITNSLVENIIMPPIGLLVGGVDFSQLGIILQNAGRYESVAEAAQAGEPVLRYGLFLNAVINFLIVAFAMFIVLRVVSRLYALRRHEEEAAPEATREAVLLEEIRDLLARQKAG
jgi:large conductance mechanosensitive channel